MPTDEQLQSQVRDVLSRFGKLPVDVTGVADEDDLFRVGLTSHASVNVMLGLEDAFDVEFPDSMLNRSTFESVAAMAAAVRSLLAAGVW